MNAALSQFLELYLQPAPAPPGMTSQDIVRKAIEFDGPPRIPYSFIIPLQTDFFETGVFPWFLDRTSETEQRNKEEVYYDEWGVGQKVTGRAWDHAFDHPLKDLRKLNRYRFPDVAAPERFDRLRPYVEQANKAGKYVVGFDPVMMFERMRSLMGFEELMVAPYTQPGRLEDLLDRLSDLTVAVIDQWARVGGIHGFMAVEDWGLQTGLQMNVETFRQFYKPRYARIVETAHQNGLHYIWHNCGQILDMMPDMIEIGVDVVQLDQPRLMGYQKLASDFGGRICFWNTLDIQWSTADDLTEHDIHAEVAEMVSALNRFNGGFMARHYPQPHDINMSTERYTAIYEAFLENGCGLQGRWST